LPNEFSEKSCSKGGLGHLYAKDAMSLMLANALKLNKFGA
jgi:2,3-bisphosphoglycerate-independent phosphoglycerate mutase